MPAHEIYIADRFILYPATGTLDIVDEAKIIIHAATAQVSYRTTQGEQRRLRFSDTACNEQIRPDEIVVNAVNDDLAATWHINLHAPTVLRLELTNRGKQALYLDDIDPLLADINGVDLGGDRATWRFYQSGWQSWSPAFSTALASNPYSGPSNAMQRAMVISAGETGSDLTSDTYTILKGQAQSLLIGFVTSAQYLSTIRVATVDGALQILKATCCGDRAVLPPGGRCQSESLALAFSSDATALLNLYLGVLADAMHARVSDTVPTGWCTWYYYFGENTEDDVLANTKAIKRHKLPLEYVLVDDGYQASIGDWTTCSRRFPHGMPWLAGQIRAAGLKPGLWLAPFGMARDSRLFADHPDWALTNRDGSPVEAWRHTGVERPILALDCTHPGVQDWLGAVFREMAAEWDIEMFKIDFCFAAALPGKHFDPSATRASSLRQGLEVIREAIGDRFLLGCGMPLAPAVGIVDGMRIGPDVSFNWQPFGEPDRSAASTKNALLNVITRSASHGRLWLNDPDCVIARPRGNDNWLSARETQTLMAVIAMSGGSIFDGDNLAALSRSRLLDLKRILPPSNLAAMPVDLFEQDQPGLLVLPCAAACGSYVVIASINWDELPRTADIDLGRLLDQPAATLFHTYDLLNRRYLGTAATHLRVENRPHSTSLVLVKPAGSRPELLASTFHLLGGVVEVKEEMWQGNQLTIVIEKTGRQRERLIFAVPAPFRVHDVRILDQPRKWQVLADGIIEVRPHFLDWTAVDLSFIEETRDAAG